MSSPPTLSPPEAAEHLAQRQGELIDRELTVLHEQGTSVSCRAGCAACCRQFVVVSPLEALAIERHVHAADPDRRSRWDESHARHAAALSCQPDLMHRLSAFRAARGYLAPEEGDTLERNYWAAQIPCPFLENEHCTIYPVRPFACREHFALTPAELCAKDLDAVRTPPTRFEFRAIAGQIGEQAFALEDRLIPLFEALTYAEAQQKASRSTVPLATVNRFMEMIIGRVLAWRRMTQP